MLKIQKNMKALMAVDSATSSIRVYIRALVL